MRIVFTGYQTDKDFFSKMDDGQMLVIETIFEYVKGRLMPLKDEIDKEEKDEEARLLPGDIPKKGVYINYPANGIGCSGYDEKLRMKIISCFSQEDIAGLSSIVWDKLI